MNISKISKKNLITKVVIMITLCFVFLINANAKQSKDKKVKQNSKDKPVSTKFIGYKECLNCHNDYEKSFEATKHQILFNENISPNGCENCHGPGGEHLDNPGEKIIKFEDLTNEKASEVCLSCHKKINETWSDEVKHSEEMSCVGCHNPHKATEKLLKKETSSLCMDCHKEKKAEISLPSHHPIKEGKINCASCHSPHKSLAESFEDSDSLSQACVNCHTEKKGPFAYEHTPVVESCLTCHKPHGSVNQNLLVNKQPTLCLQCHIIIPVEHEITSATYKTCTSCHMSLHGSNTNEKFFN